MTVRHWLDRDPVLANAEVRNSGGGLHVIPRLAELVIFTTDGRAAAGGMQHRPGRPGCAARRPPTSPARTGLSSPGRQHQRQEQVLVERLKEGTPISIDRVEHLFEQMSKSPFRTVMRVLLGAERIRPCPVCEQAGTTLSAGDFVGFCYGSCGKVKLAQLYDLFLAPRPSSSKEAVKDESQ